MLRGVLALLAAGTLCAVVAAPAEATANAPAEAPAAASPASSGTGAGGSLVVGSKRFTESYVLGELVCQTLVAAGRACTHRQGLGNTGILEQALATGAVDLYPEYTGTIVREILKRDGNPSLAELNAWLAPRGLKAAVPLGFNNTYALAMREADAARLNLRSISDLAALPPGALKLGLSHEFMVRADGWPALARTYGLRLVPGAGLDHGLAYEALRGGQVDLIDVYSTDAKIGRYALRVLVDDRRFFPAYDAVLLMRSRVDDATLAVLRTLEGRIDERTMIGLNATVELDGRTFAEAARAALSGAASVTSVQAGAASTAAVGGVASTAAVGGVGSAGAMARTGFVERLLAPDLVRLTAQHLLLVFGSLLMALLTGIPLAIAAWQRPRLGAIVLGTVGVVQTVPSLALLAFLIAVMGTIGYAPALVALWVYALLPVVANTVAGLRGVPRELQLAARALGLSPAQSLRLVLLPLARPVMLAGARTAAVVNVGTATVAAFVGAGGYGERIVAGLAVNDTQAMLAGAVPAALLALVVQGLFAAVERRLSPR